MASRRGLHIAAAASLLALVAAGLFAVAFVGRSPAGVGTSRRVELAFGPYPCLNVASLEVFGVRWEQTGGEAADLVAAPSGDRWLPVPGSFHRDDRETATLTGKDGRVRTFRNLHDRLPTLGCAIR